jgi:hypothetical protein
LRFVAAQKIDQRRYDFTSHGKWKCSEVTCESGQGLAKSMGYQCPFAAQGLAGVELPAEEGVDGQGDLAQVVLVAWDMKLVSMV